MCRAMWHAVARRTGPTKWASGHAVAYDDIATDCRCPDHFTADEAREIDAAADKGERRPVAVPRRRVAELTSRSQRRCNR